jgi:hypothetical protein
MDIIQDNHCVPSDILRTQAQLLSELRAAQLNNHAALRIYYVYSYVRNF